mmetsp:Transcript_16040/g.56034  ORF Transcript_16040/g.56034 Transcript_16040/m.56034 type:complete len:296 (+) Transcript_16040:761-1648(+)
MDVLLRLPPLPAHLEEEPHLGAVRAVLPHPVVGRARRAVRLLLCQIPHGGGVDGLRRAAVVLDPQRRHGHRVELDGLAGAVPVLLPAGGHHARVQPHGVRVPGARRGAGAVGVDGVENPQAAHHVPPRLRHLRRLGLHQPHLPGLCGPARAVGDADDARVRHGPAAGRAERARVRHEREAARSLPQLLLWRLDAPARREGSGPAAPVVALDGPRAVLPALARAARQRRGPAAQRQLRLRWLAGVGAERRRHVTCQTDARVRRAALLCYTSCCERDGVRRRHDWPPAAASGVGSLR